MAKAKTKSKATKRASKQRPAKPAAMKAATSTPAKPSAVFVTAATITAPQLRHLMKLSKEAGDELADYCKVALDAHASAAKRAEALELCVQTWNALQTV